MQKAVSVWRVSLLEGNVLGEVVDLHVGGVSGQALAVADDVLEGDALHGVLGVEAVDLDKP